ncbi:hypothetical protein HYH02_002504 [Chlamydomonas schloesseri]|uniref:Ion transport domain-containing protein n=1 Tax=Chlamydomonas schloesseri TaxID=2026947 RepID=A0A835WVD7_9CHLO|nr:hypothetical protein HYH02_002504 [Chlamydomonas schloesseri]|eukprot:KAG2453180.1 hypothetical protein HYH02_002504 [Chlamydomonas schloesseri]
MKASGEVSDVPADKEEQAPARRNVRITTGGPAILEVPPTPGGHAPGMKERGILELTLHSDGRDSQGVPVEPASMFEFCAEYSARPLWDTTSHKLAAVPDAEMPEVFRGKRVHCFTAVNEHFTFARPDYMHASFFQPAQVYVLLTSTTKVPQWLRNDFNRLPESKASMPVDWQFGLHTKVLAILSQKLALIKNARMHVWERKQHCVPGVAYTFGGTEGNSPLEDFTYLLAWRPLEPEEVVNPDSRTAVSAAVDSEENKEDRLQLLGRIAEAVAEDDMEQLKRSVEAYSARAKAAPAPWPRPSFLTSRGRPLTTIAAERNAQPKLVLYLVSQGAELDATGLRYVLNNSKALVSAGYCDMSHFMLAYLALQRNPISSAMACAQVLDECAATNSAKAKEWRALAEQLRSVSVELVGCLEKLELPPAEDAAGGGAGGGGGGANGSTGGAATEGGEVKKGGKGVDDAPLGPGVGTGGTIPAAISDVLAPRGVPCSVNDSSPLQVAYDANDLEFMAAPVVQGYLQDRWLGPDYILLALQEKGATFHYQDHHLMLRLLEGSGFVGSLGRPIMRYHSYILHMLVFASRAFYDSPRGRWIWKVFLEAFFLYIYHSIQLMPDEASLHWQHIVFVLYLAGMLVDEWQEGAHQYGGRIAQYFASGFNMVEALCWLMLVAASALKIAMWAIPDGQDNPVWADLQTAKEFIYNTASILVWSRLLQYIIPLYDGMGSQLMIMSQMFREVFKFAIPGTVLLTGVTFCLYSMFNDRIPELSSFPKVMLKLFRTFLGETMFDVFEEDPTPIYQIYGIIITLMYALVATVVLANLLIALISYHFQPEKTEAQSKFQMAEILAHYEYMIDHHLIGAPFSLPQLILRNLLPSGVRQKGSSSWLAETFSLSPMDGIVVSGENTENKFIPIGTNEVPYLIYLLTFYPAVLGMSWAMYFGMAPYCIAYFTFLGYKKWTGESENKNAPALGSGGAAKVGPDAASAAAATAAKSQKSPIDMFEMSGKRHVHATESQMDAATHDGQPNYEAWDNKKNALQLLHMAWSMTIYIVTRPLWLVLGVLGYLVLLGGLLITVWLGAYTWIGKVAFHTYWVVRGWLQGWFGDTNIVLAKKDASTNQSTTSTANQALARVHDCTWVRVQQALLKDGGQVITWKELSRALRHAGFKRWELAVARVGALAPSEAATGAKYAVRRMAMANTVALGAAAGISDAARRQSMTQRAEATLRLLGNTGGGKDDEASSSSSSSGGGDSSDDENASPRYGGYGMSRQHGHLRMHQGQTAPAAAAGGAVAAGSIGGAAPGGAGGGVLDSAAAMGHLARKMARKLGRELKETVASLKAEVVEQVARTTSVAAGLVGMGNSGMSLAGPGPAGPSTTAGGGAPYGGIPRGPSGSGVLAMGGPGGLSRRESGTRRESSLED